MGIVTELRLTFRPEDHTYWLGERELISLTTLLEQEGVIDTRFYNEEGKLRGTMVHMATQLVDEPTGDAFDPAKIPEQWLGYVNAWRQFKSEMGFVVEHAEYRTCNESLCFACTIDRIGHFSNPLTSPGNGKWIIEQKTGGHEAWHWLQLAGQRECVDFACQVAVVYLKDDGGYTFLRRDFSEHLSDRQTFKATIVIANWKRRNG
jgi:hypothetical protein